MSKSQLDASGACESLCYSARRLVTIAYAAQIVRSSQAVQVGSKHRPLTLSLEVHPTTISHLTIDGSSDVQSIGDVRAHLVEAGPLVGLAANYVELTGEITSLLTQEIFSAAQYCGKTVTAVLGLIDQPNSPGISIPVAKLNPETETLLRIARRCQSQQRKENRQPSKRSK